jgi:acyl-CoA dehydrogenase
VTDALRELAHRVGAESAASLEGLGEDEAARRALEVLAGAELLGWAVPAAHGGADTGGLAGPEQVSVRGLCALRGALAYHSGMLDVMLVMQGLGSYAVARAGADELRASVLPEVASGRRIAAFALTEPDAGSDLSQVATRAERVGDQWRVDGHKTFISNAGLADSYSLLARTSGAPGEREGLTMFHVPGDAPGIEVRRFEVMAPHPIGEVLFRGVELDDDQRLGDEGAGLELALGVLARFRTSVAAAANGFARRALAESVAHLKSRMQFGKPLSAFQGLRFDLAEMDARVRAAELLVDEAAAAVDAELDSTAAVARAKLMATETASWVCDRAVQHLGGRGVRRGEIVERLFREVRALRIYEGTSEVQKLILSKEVLEG